MKWFKLLLASDDDSAVRRKAEQFVARRSLDEESVLRDYLTHLLSSAQKQAAVMHGKRSWRILAALPSQTDQLSRQRYRECLSAACERVQMHVDQVKIFSESLAAARSCVSRSRSPGSYLYAIHDGGGGTTHLHMMLVQVFVDGKVVRKDIWVPEYLSRGGEDLEVLYVQYIQNHYPAISSSEMAGFMRLWNTNIKVKQRENWVLDGETVALLPKHFSISVSFCHDLETQVFDPGLDPIVEYLVQELENGLEELATQKITGLSCASSLEVFMNDIGSEDNQAAVNTSSGAREKFNRMESATNSVHGVHKFRFISSGGQSADIRLQTKLRAHFGEAWVQAPDHRTCVVDGLLLLGDDEQQARSDLPCAKFAYGFIGWNLAQNE